MRPEHGVTSSGVAPGVRQAKNAQAHSLVEAKGRAVLQSEPPGFSVAKAGGIKQGPGCSLVENRFSGGIGAIGG